MRKVWQKIAAVMLVIGASAAMMLPVVVGTQAVWARDPGLDNGIYFDQVTDPSGGGTTNPSGGSPSGGTPTSGGEPSTSPDGKKPSTSILDPNLNIKGILQLALKILMYGLGAAAVLGVIIAGIIYMTARDNPQQVAVAKKRLIDIVIGLVVWALMYTLLNWLIPGSLNLGV